jgi:hypothetical protein
VADRQGQDAAAIQLAHVTVLSRMTVMTHSASRLLAVLATAVTLAACATTPRPPAPPPTKTLDAKTQLETGRIR